MNKRSISHLVLIITSAISACNGPETKENKSTVLPSSTTVSSVESEKYVIDTKESLVTWYGSNAIISKGSHYGYANISKGELLIDKTGKLVGGTVEVDMNSLADEKHGTDNNLIDHLKSADFFETQKFPISTFGVVMTTSAKGDSVNVTGVLNLKGIAQTITFPAAIEVKNGVVQANGKLSIDRTQFGVRYKSKTFVFDLADDLIADEIRFDVKLVGKNSSQ